MQKGQIILVLILIMTVALAIGLSIVQKSLVNVSTASKVEQSSRAFSAAEAGIEKALKGDTTLQSFSGSSSSIKEITDTGLTPCVPGQAGCVQGVGIRQVVLEKEPLAKEDTAHVWLADLNSSSNPPTPFYTQSSLDVYWGNSSIDKAALELTLVYYDGSLYKSRKWYLDDISATRNPANGFDTVSCPGTYQFGTNTYQCKKTLGDGTGINNGPLPSGSPNILMLIRARLLYNTTRQLFAVQAVGTCGSECSLPPQARTIFSTGASGETQRRVKVYQENRVVPQFFDYAIFSAGEITK